MKNIFKRKKETSGLASAKEMRGCVEKFFTDESERVRDKTRAYVNEHIAPEIACRARCGMSDLSVELPSAYSKELFMSILKGKGYTVDDFDRKIEIYW